MKLSLLVFTYFLFLAQYSQAEFGGEDYISSQGPDSVCRILIQDAKGIGLCTGSLFAENKILTAAHCLDHLKPETKVFIQCGYAGFEKNQLTEVKTKSGNRLFVKGFQFKETAEAISYQIHPQWTAGDMWFDTAVITLDRPLTLETMNVVDLPVLAEGAECFSAGYGLNHQATMGFLNVGKIDAQELQKNKFQFNETNFAVEVTDPLEEDQDILEMPTIVKYFIPKTMKYSSISQGDSGGPVYCRQSGNGPFFQVAINRAMYYERKKRAGLKIYDFHFTPAYSRTDLSFIKK